MFVLRRPIAPSRRIYVCIWGKVKATPHHTGGYQHKHRLTFQHPEILCAAQSVLVFVCEAFAEKKKKERRSRSLLTHVNKVAVLAEYDMDAPGVIWTETLGQVLPQSRHGALCNVKSVILLFTPQLSERKEKNDYGPAQRFWRLINLQTHGLLVILEVPDLFSCPTNPHSPARRAPVPLRRAPSIDGIASWNNI